MTLLYIIALFPVIVGLVLFIKNQKQIHVMEWIIGSLCAFVVASIIHLISFYSQVGDTETWSGRIIQAKQFSAWREQYKEEIYKTETYTDSDGKTQSRRVFSHYETRRRWHDEMFVLYSDIETNYNVNKKEYLDVVVKFGGERKPIKGDRTTSETSSKMIDGDPYDYISSPQNGYIMPVTSRRMFKNRIKASKSLFNYTDVPKGVNVYGYPNNGNWRRSDRVMGVASKYIDIYEWDKLNAVLGPMKRVNLIIIGFQDQDASISNWQESEYIGGKKNDLVLCFNVSGTNVTWTKVFGWTEQEICKRNLETILLTNPINNDILPKIRDEVVRNYVLKDFSKFDYIGISPPKWMYPVYLLILLLTQGVLWYIFHHNDFKGEYNDYRSKRKIWRG